MSQKPNRPPFGIQIFFLGVLVLSGAFDAQLPDAYAQNERVLAVVDGTKITQQDVDASVISQIITLEEQLYAIRKSALENLITRVVLQNEAKKRGVSISELKKQLTDVKVEIQAEQVNDLYSEYASAFAAMSAEEAKERLRLDLESQARMKNYREAITKLRDGARIEFLLPAPKLQFMTTSKSPRLGPENAPVTIIEFSDFQCPFCRSSQGTLKQILQHYKKEVRLIFVNLPLETHSEAFMSARAAYCAGEQGRFWQYHDQLFAVEDLSLEVLKKIAAELKLDQSNFDTCLKSEDSRLAILTDLREAKRLGIAATPTFIINGRLLRGARAFDEFKDVIEGELLPAPRVAPARQPSHLTP